MEILDPSLRSPTAEDIGRRVRAKMEEAAKPKRWSDLHGPVAQEATDLRTAPGSEYGADIISRDSFRELIGSLIQRDRHSENLSFCRFARTFVDSSEGEQVTRPELLGFLSSMRTAGLVNNTGFRAMEALSNRARTGL